MSLSRTRSQSSEYCPTLPKVRYTKLPAPLETYPRPGQYFNDDPEGYFPLPESIAIFIDKKRKRSRSSSSKGGGDHLASIMEEFVIPNKDKDWLNLQEIKELENQERQDKTWNPTYKYVPCFERNSETEPIEGKKHKLFKRGQNCGEQAEQGRKFTWTRVHLLIARKPDPAAAEHDETQQKFFNAAYQVCKNSFFYHCSRPGTTQGIGGGYFKEAWGHATSIGLLISDCGKTGNTEDCGFIVLGFCLLRNYSGVVNDKFQRQKSFMSDATSIPGTESIAFPDYALYIDVVCSKISTAQNLMKLFTQSPNRSEQKWKKVVFNDTAAIGKPHYTLLRAIPSVYTYYPIMYNFIRSLDNKEMHPIFKVRQDDIINMLSLSSSSVVDTNKDFSSIATKMFGVQNKGWVIKEATKKTPARLYVYKLTKEFVTFIKTHNLAAAAVDIFKPTKYVCGDSDSNGYLYGLYVNGSI